MYLIGRVSSNVLKACISRNQLLKTKVIPTANAAYHNAPLSKSGSKNQILSDKQLQQILPNLVVPTKHFSTTACQLAGHKDHDHSKIWTLERLLSIALLPVIPAALLNPCQQLDTALAIIMVMHTHFGLEAIVVDYIRPILFGDMAPKIGLGLLYLLSITTLAGLLNLIYNDCGLSNAIISVWKK